VLEYALSVSAARPPPALSGDIRDMVTSHASSLRRTVADLLLEDGEAAARRVPRLCELGLDVCACVAAGRRGGGGGGGGGGAMRDFERELGDFTRELEAKVGEGAVAAEALLVTLTFNAA
jgi:hypothetical protein